MTRIAIHSHTGTHIDAPSHFIEGGRTLDDYTVTDLSGPALVIDCSTVHTQSLTTSDIATNRLAIEQGMAVIIYTGHSASQDDSRSYYTEYPHLDRSAVDYLINSQIRLLALDTPSPDPVPGTSETDFYAHYRFLSRNIPIIENVGPRVSDFASMVVQLIVAPLPIQGADGAPVVPVVTHLGT